MNYKSEAKDCSAKRVERIKRDCGGGEVRMPRKSGGATVHTVERERKMEPFSIEGGTAKKRLDRAGYKKGGAAKSKGTQVNIIIADKGAQGGAGAAMGPPAGMPPPPMAQQMPPRPPMAPPGAGAPMGGMGAPPPGMMPRKRGGRAGYDAGAGSGLGRLEKAAAYGAKT